MNYSNLMEAVNARIKANGKREITGDILNDVLRAMVASLGAGYQVGGTLRPDDRPKVEDQRVAYLAVEPGMYLYAGGFEVTELSLITYGAEWYMYPLGVPFGSQIAEDIAAAVEVEKTRAMAAEKALNDAIATEASERATADSVLDNAIKAETKRAADAEGVLTRAVEDEKARAMAAEGANASAITAEADARAKADTALQGNITAEATAREAADYALAAKITAEETARKAADATLQSNIDKKVSKDDENWLETFMPRITLNYDSTVKSVTVGDNVAADYSTISTRLSHYGGVVSGSPEHPGYSGHPAQGRVVQVYSGSGQSFPNVIFVTAIFNYAKTFSRTFANSIYEIVLNYNSEGEFVSGTYKFKPISEVFEIGLSSRDGIQYRISKTYDDFRKMAEEYEINGTLPLIILNDSWTQANFILTRYDNAYFSAEKSFQLSFISIRDKQLIGYYLIVEKTKTTITPFEFQAQTKEEVESAAKKLNELENSVTQVQDDVQGLAEYLQPIIEDLQSGKQDVISDLETIRSQAKNGQTAFGWGDHAKAGYAKPFVITLTKGSSAENPLVVDKTYEEVATALSANSLILLKGNIDEATEIYQLAWAEHYPSIGIVLLFSYVEGDSSSCYSVHLTFGVQGDVDVKTRGDKFATDEQVKAKQDTLVSGTNIKTINGESVLGSGDLKVSGGLPTIQAGTGANSEVFNGIAPTSASGEKSHAEGEDSDAHGNLSHAEGFSNTAYGYASHAEGNSTSANGDNSHAEGFGGIANGLGSHAEGENTVATRQASHAEGVANVEDGAAIHQVGIGVGAIRKDAHRINYDGKHYILGIGGFDGTKATEDLNGEKDLATVINEMTPAILNYNGLGGNNEPIFVGEDGTALTRVQICAILNGVNANRVVLKNKASSVMQTSSAKFLQCDVNAFVIGFEGANAAGQIFDILYKWDAAAATVLRAEILYNPS